ncbi:cystathionine beta-lyase [Methylocella tundrae]|uniref:Putative cystathionine beta-lyase n=1 Tax=Methylocella tundrae TaxID=227605 RepID=A0A4V6IN16_METTU|nr:cystathionine beta-lyase [Methylocella tundrae]WPP04065.1 cystathionine beta-lyase [Methylocella tundrae]VFU10302.1 putative cystathionine beta-lyase [Methylocella tundrae]
MTETTEKDRKNLKTRTKLVYAGRHPSEQHGFVNTPIYRGSTVLFPTFHDLVTRNAEFTYGTQGSPTTKALTDAWTELSGAAGTILAPTGLAAITLALLTAVKAGDHILVTDSIYRPSRIFCDTILARMGVETTYFDPWISHKVEHLIRPNTSVIFLETPGSQSFELPDVPAIAALARAKGVCVILDNTWATPLFFPPHERGADMAIEAGTKYLSGHSDLLLGLVSANAEWLGRLSATADAFAMCAGPEDVFLALRGLRTLELRLREAQRQALDIARWLEGRREVAAVLHPALPSCPGHALWKRDFSGSSGLFSVLLAPCSQRAVAAMLDGLELFGMGFSWGGFESLVIPFDCRSYRTATPWNPPGPALRFNIGLEDVEDLKADLDRGFERLRKAG